MRALTASEGALCEALCADFDRREALMRDASVPLRVRAECRYINLRVFAAVRELCADDGEARMFLREIGARCGYANSACAYGESVYKRKKAEIRVNVLRLLHLLA